MWEALICIVGLLNLSVTCIIKPTLQPSEMTLTSPHLGHMDPVTAAPSASCYPGGGWQILQALLLAWVRLADQGVNDGYIHHRAPSVLSDVELSFPSHLPYTTPRRCCSSFFIFKILQCRWFHVGSSLNLWILETPSSLLNVHWKDSSYCHCQWQQ